MTFHPSPHPLAKDYFFLKSPLPTAFMLAIYLVATLKLIPTWMTKREAFGLKNIMIIYNAGQIALNGVLCAMIGLYMIRSKMSFFCAEVNYDDIEGLNLHYCYFILKCLDLLETVIYVLRKKMSQVSFLHLYHHVGMVLSTWISCTYFPAAQGSFLGLANTFVHTIMYFYYLCTSLNVRSLDNLRWKKHLTQLQIAHQIFTFFAFLMPVLHGNCNYPVAISCLYGIQCAVLVKLFTNFYIKTYMKPKDENSKAA